MSISDDFEEFWHAYPRKVGKLAALKAYRKARTMASADEILTGVQSYVEHLPEDPQFICHASTFCNQGRWMDSYETPTPKAKPTTGAYKPYVRLKDRTG
jgi:allantoicase